MNRREFIRLNATAASALLFSRGIGAAGQTTSEDQDRSSSESADDRILRIRRGDCIVSVKDKAGKPAAGVTVEVEQQSHAFLFGCNFFRFDRLRDEGLESEYRSKFADVFNFATLPFYWWNYERQKGRPMYDYTEKAARWCADHGITRKGHPLAWDYADPSWLPQDFSEIKKLSIGRVEEIVTRFKGQIDIWDVVNEPTHLGRFGTRMGEWAQSLGAVPYVKMHLQTARSARPDATLLVNDYRTDQEYYDILSQVRSDDKRLFDVIGIQSHMHGGVWSPEHTLSVCRRFAKLNLPIHFTETTILSGRDKVNNEWEDTNPADEERQAEETAEFYTTLFSHPSVQAITWWDFSDNGAWQGAAAGWLRKDMSSKPVYERMHELIKNKWWTQESARTSEEGELEFKAFYGTHKVRVKTAGGEVIEQTVDVTKSGNNRFDIVI
ncbi:MAG: endo-1,4-beta-xylanase [Verrucomicrobia bacterium]|nr:endo-1,4-beta-xylanase [Verrucomicrobiota bacterium]MCF7709040.1 endo-1,4-beta-xylanase [Verrucomicrobiota bacterium]